MRKTRKILLVFVLALVFTSLFAVPAFAVTEDEVQQQVNAIGREGVTGNIFIWFLCAIGFLKVSQKIDSFMSSLGINVGHTGGSMLAEHDSRPRHSVGQIFRRARQGRLPAAVLRPAGLPAADLPVAGLPVLSAAASRIARSKTPPAARKAVLAARLLLPRWKRAAVSLTASSAR